MGRTFLAVIGSLVLLNIMVVAALTVAWSVLGPEGAFEPDSWETSMTWVGTMLGVGAIAALIAGVVCRLIAPAGNAPMHFAVLVLIMGLAMAVMGPPEPDPPAGAEAATARPADITMMDAMNSAQPPSWYQWANAFIGPVGILIGASLLGGRKPGASAVSD